jgi:hypothetical protein
MKYSHLQMKFLEPLSPCQEAASDLSPAPLITFCYFPAANTQLARFNNPAYSNLCTDYIWSIIKYYNRSCEMWSISKMGRHIFKDQRKLMPLKSQLQHHTSLPPSVFPGIDRFKVAHPWTTLSILQQFVPCSILCEAKLQLKTILHVHIGTPSAVNKNQNPPLKKRRTRT